MNRTFRANGKLLLTGEYFVLQGSRSLVMPLKYGQTLTAKDVSESSIIEWRSLEKDDEWFSATFDKNTLHPLISSDAQIAEKLSQVFSKIRKIKPAVFSPSRGIGFETNLEFNRNYGWGSSSSLLVLLAQWAGIDPFQLHFSLSGGSAYDIAAAMEDSLFIYTMGDGIPTIKKSDFLLPFSGQIFFCYLGNKQNSEREVSRYLMMSPPSKNKLEQLSTITDEIEQCENLETFMILVNKHEEIISSHLGKPSLKEERFKDYTGVVKSLGAWGGDFAMFVSKEGLSPLKAYLNKKGIYTVFSMEDLIITN